VSEPFGDPHRGKGLAARVIVHLSRLKPLGPNDLAPLERTQQGMVILFGVRQGSLVKVLQRLLAGDVVLVERWYVAGAHRRLKIYSLTALGRALARDLRRRPDLPSPPDSVSDWSPPRAPGDRSSPEAADRLGA
jgi:DNA-binding PadR family transcriptional regulator